MSAALVQYWFVCLGDSDLGRATSPMIDKWSKATFSLQSQASNHFTEVRPDQLVDTVDERVVLERLFQKEVKAGGSRR